ncbi:hypothetical protein D3C71_1589710 [compost metagenome]
MLHLHGLQHHDGLALGHYIAGLGGRGDDLAGHGGAQAAVGGGGASLASPLSPAIKPNGVAVTEENNVIARDKDARASWLPVHDQFVQGAARSHFRMQNMATVVAVNQIALVDAERRRRCHVDRGGNGLAVSVKPKLRARRPVQAEAIKTFRGGVPSCIALRFFVPDQAMFILSKRRQSSCI